MTCKKILACATALAVLTGTAMAHEGAMGVVKERMDAMGAIKDANKVLRGIMRGRSAYDADKVQASAAVIRSHSGAALTALFPDGSLTPPTEAKPEIWQDWQSFEALAMQMELYAAGLEAAAANGLGDGGQAGAGMGGSGAGALPSLEDLSAMPANAVYKGLGETCSACHSRFRVD